jgi:hypothetical protein
MAFMSEETNIFLGVDSSGSSTWSKLRLRLLSRLLQVDLQASVASTP